MARDGNQVASQHVCIDRATSILLDFALATPCAATHPSGRVKFPSQSWNIRNDPLKTYSSFQRVMWIPGSGSTLQCKIKQIPALPKSHKWWDLRIAKTEADIHNYLTSSITEVLQQILTQSTRRGMASDLCFSARIHRGGLSKALLSLDCKLKV